MDTSRDEDIERLERELRESLEREAALREALEDGRGALMNVRTFCPNHAAWPWLDGWYTQARAALGR